MTINIKQTIKISIIAITILLAPFVYSSLSHMNNEGFSFISGIFDVPEAYAQDSPRRIDGPGLRTPGGSAYNGISAEKDLGQFIVGITNFTLSFVTGVAVLMMLYGGYLWIVGIGEDQMIEKAKKIIAGSIIGILLVISAYTIVNTVSGFGDESDMCAVAIQDNDLAMQLFYCQNTATGNSAIAGIGGLIGGLMGSIF